MPRIQGHAPMMSRRTGESAIQGPVPRPAETEDVLKLSGFWIKPGEADGTSLSSRRGIPFFSQSHTTTTMMQSLKVVAAAKPAVVAKNSVQTKKVNMAVKNVEVRTEARSLFSGALNL